MFRNKLNKKNIIKNLMNRFGKILIDIIINKIV